MIKGLMELSQNKQLSETEVRSLISDVERRALAVPELHIEVPLKNHFSKGVYAREIFIPKGAIVIGKIHKFQNLNILSKGELSIISIDGIERVKAPFTIVSKPGVKRMAFAHEDSVWTTVHGTDETDLDKIEEIFIAKTYADVPRLEGE